MMRLLSVLLIFIAAPTQAINKPSVDLLTKPTLLLSQGRLTQASKSFHYQSNFVLSQEAKFGTTKMWQTAGLAEGLAAIAAEKNNDAIAYEYWSNSVRYFLMGGSSWETLQSEIFREFNQANRQLQVSAPQGGGGATLDDLWLQKLSIIEVWEDKLGYFSYSAPSPGLISSAKSQAIVIEGVSSGSVQYKTHNPTSKLSISSSFFATPTFVPNAVQMPETTGSTEVPSANDVNHKSKYINHESKIVPTATEKHLVSQSEDHEKGDLDRTPSRVPINASSHLQSNDSTDATLPVVNQKPADQGYYIDDVIEIQPLEVEKTTIQQMELNESDINHDITSKQINNDITNVNLYGHGATLKEQQDPLKEENKHVHRGNLEAGSTKGVSAIQRRSFAPDSTE